MPRRKQIAIGFVIGFLVVMFSGGCKPANPPYPQPIPTPVGWS